ncbi:unnamed protein product [Gordionus sp. m RMFG-2023]
MGLGFASIPFIAHEMGHNLNFDHDQEKNCQSGFIMSSYVEKAAKKWSTCTKKDWLTFFKDPEYDCLYHMYPLTPIKNSFKKLNFPGSRYTLDEQCQNSYSVQSKWNRSQKLERVCEVIQCTGTSLDEPTFTALEGTRCGHMKFCRAHMCLTVNRKNVTILIDYNKTTTLASIQNSVTK